MTVVIIGVLLVLGVVVLWACVKVGSDDDDLAGRG